jgi:hypothetical protein
MKMLMIVFRESLENDIRAILDRYQVSAFTEMLDVVGKGEAGAAFHSLSWPGLNNMILAALPEAQADQVVAALKAFHDVQVQSEKGAKIPMRVFTLPCELAV